MRVKNRVREIMNEIEPLREEVHTLDKKWKGQAASPKRPCQQGEQRRHA